MHRLQVVLGVPLTSYLWRTNLGHCVANNDYFLFLFIFWCLKQGYEAK